MYISMFWIGVATTILTEIVLLTIAAIYKDSDNRGDDR